MVRRYFQVLCATLPFNKATVSLLRWRQPQGFIMRHWLQANLADRDFTAERGHVIVLSSGTADPKDAQRTLKERQDAQERNKHRYCQQHPSHPSGAPKDWPSACLSLHYLACIVGVSGSMPISTPQS